MLSFLKKILSRLREWACRLFGPKPAAPLPQAVLPDRIEEALIHTNWDHRDVLIGTFRNQRQFRICLENGFYYIPAYLVEDWNLPIRYVAAFQTPRIFPKAPGIRWYGCVRQISLVPRSSIREVPQVHGRPEEPYYRLELQSWLPLKQAIAPREAGFVREFTNLFLLEHMRFVPELLLGSEEEFRLYTELKRRMDRHLPLSFALGEMQVLCDGDELRLCREGNQLGSCTLREFSKAPIAAFRSLYRNGCAAETG